MSISADVIKRVIVANQTEVPVRCPSAAVRHSTYATLHVRQPLRLLPVIG